MVADVARRTLAAILIACSALVVASPAAASPSGRRQIEVFPGPHALAKALAEARPGDALELHTGTYRDDVTITTPTITIEPAGDGPVLIDGGCREIETIEVEADGVTIQGDIAVAGGLIYDLHYLDVLSGILEGVTLRSTCHTQFGVRPGADGAGDRLEQHRRRVRRRRHPGERHRGHRRGPDPDRFERGLQQ